MVSRRTILLTGICFLAGMPTDARAQVDLSREVIRSPVDGPLYYGAKHEYKWAFNQWGPTPGASDPNTHRRRSDGTGYGLLRADDYYAWDANIYAFTNGEQLLPVYAVADGKVVSWFGISEAGGKLSPATGNFAKSYGAVLLEHVASGGVNWFPLQCTCTTFR